MRFPIALLVVALLAATPAAAANLVLVRQSCTGISIPCETSIYDAVTWANANASATNPVTIDIGPGRWPQLTLANATKHTTFRGAGRSATVIAGSPNGITTVANVGLAFSDMRIEGTDYAVFWAGGGNATWTNVDLVGEPEIDGGKREAFSLGWGDECLNGQEENSLQYFFGSRVSNRGRPCKIHSGGSCGVVQKGHFAYHTECSETWFFGGEVLLDFDVEGASDVAIASAAVNVDVQADFRAFGTAIRARMTEDTGVPNAMHAEDPSQLIAVRVSSDTDPATTRGTFHMHGGIINASVDPSVSGHGATGIAVTDDAFAHTPGTAYVMKPSSGATAARVRTVGTGDAQVPFLWQSGDTPPASTGETNQLLSVDGKDLFVETDCSSDGDCNGGGSEAHLLVYNESLCPTEYWLDAVTGRCRNDIADPVADALIDHDQQLSDLWDEIDALKNP